MSDLTYNLKKKKWTHVASSVVKNLEAKNGECKQISSMPIGCMEN
jgi:hypothetical protein